MGGSRCGIDRRVSASFHEKRETKREGKGDKKRWTEQQCQLIVTLKTVNYISV